MLFVEIFDQKRRCKKKMNQKAMSEDERRQKQYIKMTQTPVPKLVLKLAVPTTVSMVISSIYNMADTFFVSCLKDTSATAAVAVVFALMAIIQAIGFTVGMGSGSWISRLLGEKKNDKASTVGSSAFFFAASLGLIILVFGRIFVKPLMTLLGATETIMPYAVDYGQYILFAAPIMALSFTLNNILRAEGKATFSMIGIGLGGLLNMVLDPIFIFGKGYVFSLFGLSVKMPFGLGMGISGAALATAISQCISFLLLLLPFIFGKTSVKLRIPSISKKVHDYLDILRFGLPSFCRQGLSSASSVLLTNSAKIFAGAAADPAIAGMGVVSRVFMFVFSLCLGLGQGYQPVLGFNYGAKKYSRVKKAFNFTFYTSTAMFVVMATAGFIFAPQILSLFADSDVEDGKKMIEVAVSAFRAQCISMPFIPVGVMCNMTFQSLGRSTVATFLSSLRQGLFYIPLMLILPRFIGLSGVEYTQAISDILTCAVSIPFAIGFLKEVSALCVSEKE